MKRIITIGREFGSGGRELGRRLAEELGIAYYDREIVEELIKRTELTENYVSRVEESRPLPLLPITTARTFYIPVSYASENRLSIYKQESEIIREMAKKSDCVIVGRCADYILRDLKPFRLFIYADMSSKAERCRAKGSDIAAIADKELWQKIISIDKKRARYYQFYTEQRWGDKSNYDLCINTASAEIKEIIPAITKFIVLRK